VVLRKLGVDEEELVKIVDKETFSQINKYVHSFYEELLDEINEVKYDIITNILNIKDTKQINIPDILNNLNLSTRDINKLHN